MTSQTNIVILGAGYAGLMAALRLSGRTRRMPVAITLVAGNETFVERPRLHLAAVGEELPRHPIDKLLRGTRVHFRHAWVTAIDAEQRLVHVRQDGGPAAIPYDFLVYALGSHTDQESVPGIGYNAYVLDAHGPNAAPVLFARLAALSAAGGRGAGRVVVCGGGATGIEGATEIKGRFPRLQVSLVTAGRFGTFKGPRVERHLREALAQQEIQIHEGQRVAAVEPGQVVLASGARLACDACLWACGFRASPLAQQAGFTVNERGQMLVDGCGRALRHPQVFGAGDAAQPAEESRWPVRMSLLAAVTRGAHAAENIAAALQGRPLTPLRMVYYGQGIALGQRDAVGFAAFPDDRPHGPILRGRKAAATRNFFVGLLFSLLGLERRWPGFFFVPFVPGFVFGSRRAEWRSAQPGQHTGAE
jgi:NADH dehydrogenase